MTAVGMILTVGPNGPIPTGTDHAAMVKAGVLLITVGVSFGWVFLCRLAAMATSAFPHASQPRLRR